MSFEIKGKVALISGGASGIGIVLAKELLKNGLKGVTLADVNPDFGKQALQEIEKEYGPNRAIFVQTDVTNMENYENAFKKTIEVFKNLDILVNNAGICNDSVWQKEIEINIKGVLHGMLLGLDKYIPKYRSGPEGVIVNMASIAGLTPHPTVPVYSTTKFALIGMSKSFGHEDHYKQTKIKVLALCPGATDTPLTRNMTGRTLGPRYEELSQSLLKELRMQPIDVVAIAAVKIVKEAPTATVWVIEDGLGLYEFVLPPRESFATK